ncbi:MAG: PAS domain S-box protein, partial [Desulfobacterales bacterium]|nr:PAS domain S-box protein [Desulfobacterales bacterium]
HVLLAGEHKYEAIAPVEKEGRRLGTAIMGYRLGHRAESIAHLWKILLIALIILVGIAIVGCFAFANTITGPIQKLADATAKVSKGELDIKVPIESKDEIGELAASFNKMAADLRNTTVSRDLLMKEVAERKEGEAALRESEEKFRHITASAKDAIMMMDDEGNISYWNEASEEIFGYSAQEALGKELHILLAPQQYHDAYRKGMGTFKTTGQGATIGKTLELEAMKKDGTIFPMELSVSSVKIKEKWHAIGIIRDITERKRVEETVRQRNRELELLNQAAWAVNSVLHLDQVLATILDQVPHLLDVLGSTIWLADPETGGLVCQHATGPHSQELLGWRLASGEGVAGWVARSGDSVIIPDAQADARYSKQVDQQTGEETRSVLCIPLRAKGEVTGVLEVVDTEAGRFDVSDLGLLEALAAFATTAIENAQLYEQAGQEIAKRRRIEADLEKMLAALQKSKERFRSLTESTSDWVWEVDVNGAYTYASPKVKDLLGYGPDEVIGKTPFDLMPADEAKRAAGLFRDILESREPFAELEKTSLYKDGSQVVLESSGVPILDEAGNLLGYRGIDRDITKRKKAEQELQKASYELEDKARELEKANKELKEATVQLVQSEKLSALGELTAGVTHELNQPLNGIKITSQAILRDIEKNRFEEENIGQDLTEIVNQVNKMAGIIDHMRVYARHSEGMPKEIINVNTLIEGPFKLLGQQLKTHNIEVIKELAPDLPEVMGNPIRLEQVFMNLITNARNAVDSCGKENKRIEIRAYKIDDRQDVAVEVKDNGSGIPEHLREKIFQPFFTTKEPGEGTGLGLSVSSKIIEEHKGRIELESKVDEGTTFRVILPVAV